MDITLDKKLDQAIKSGLSYEQYRALVKTNIAQGKSTGTNHSEEMVQYTRLNDKRMDRLDKTTILSPTFDHLKDKVHSKYIWLLITEGWCGDAAQSVPVIAKIASLFPQIELKIILRDEHPEVIDSYLTNGGRSIPKLIGYRKDGLNEVGTWGPRPKAAQQLVSNYKSLENKPPYSEFVKEVQLWYAKDKTVSIQGELYDFLRKHT